MNLLSMLLLSAIAFSQTKVGSKYISETDASLTIKTISIIPFSDNLNGIYAKPLESHLIDFAEKDPQWSLVKKNLSMPPVFDLAESPEEVRKLFKTSKADALIWGQILKGPKELRIKIILFSKDGNPLVFDEISETRNLTIEELKEKIILSYLNLKKSLPYGGLILSRNGLDVTLNLGESQGLHSMDELSIIQVLQIQRHPVKKFIVGTEKEVIGKIKLMKVEPTLSFGKIIFEKEPGLVIAGSKVLSKMGIYYPNPTIANSKSEDISFGEKPKEWHPAPTPQFGKITAGLGLTNYELAQTLINAGPINTNSSFSPGLLLGLEMWLTPNWYLNFNLRQMVIAVANPRPSSSPSKLNLTLGQYAGLVGYNFLGEDNSSEGSTVKILLGFSNTDISSSGSEPTGATSMNYSGILFRLESDFLIQTEESHFTMGLGFDWFLFPQASENLSSGASATHRIYSFDVFAKTPWRENLNLKYDFKLENYNSEFSGTGDRVDPASNITHSLMTFSVALEYLF